MHIPNLYIYICVGMVKEKHSQQTKVTGWMQIIHICLVLLFTVLFCIHTKHIVKETLK